MTVGFFMPLPLAVMIPFMAGQSFAMGEAFGKGFQYGKRKISSMTNEQFNAMSAKDHFSETTADISAMIPSMKSQMNNFSTLQTDIIKTLIEQLKDAGITIGEAVAELGQDIFKEGPPGGTKIAQQSLDQLRSIVGLPPLYSKLVSPAGIAALFSFWDKAGKSSALKATLNPVNWVWNELKNIFNQTPPPSVVTQVVGSAPKFIGPIFQKQDKDTSGIQPDIRIEEQLKNKIVADSTTDIGTRRKAGQSQIREFNLLNRQITLAITAFKAEKNEAVRARILKLLNFHRQQLANLKARYIF